MASMFRDISRTPLGPLLAPEAIVVLQQAGLTVTERENGELAIAPADPTVPTLVATYSDDHAGIVYRFEQTEEWYGGNAPAVQSVLLSLMLLGGVL